MCADSGQGQSCAVIGPSCPGLGQSCAVIGPSCAAIGQSCAVIVQLIL